MNSTDDFVENRPFLYEFLRHSSDTSNKDELEGIR